MSRVKLMLDVIEDVCNVAESLQHLAESLKVLVKAIGPDEQPKLTTVENKATAVPTPILRRCTVRPLNFVPTSVRSMV